MDLRVETGRLPVPGETVRGGNFRALPGGKGANQACAVARMGIRCAMIGAVGDDAFGAALLAALREDGVDVTAVRRVCGLATGVAMIAVDDRGQNQIIISAGANDSVAVNDIPAQAAQIRAAKALIVQLEIPLPVVEASLRAASGQGVMTVLNPAPSRELTDDLLGLCDWIIPNEIEASQLTGLRCGNPSDAALVARRLRERSGGRARIVVTLGDVGAWLDSPEFRGLVPGEVVAPVDTVAAGDTFVGAFVARLVEGAGPCEAARFAGAAAAMAVTRPGAQASIPRRSEVDEWLRGR